MMVRQEINWGDGKLLKRLDADPVDLAVAVAKAELAKLK
jgi:hypothetical protein